MEVNYKILVAEDNPTDAELTIKEIRKTLPGCQFLVVETKDDFNNALNNFQPDLIVSDYTMPQFDGMTALRLTIQRSPETPLIIVTGSINEEVAVECMKAGASDYILKDSLKRLGQSVLQSLEKKKNILQRLEAEQKLMDSEEEYRGLFNGMNETAWIISTGGELLDVNTAAEKVLGYTRDELLKIGLRGIDRNLKPEEIKKLAGAMARDISQVFQTKHTTRDGREIPVEVSSTLIHYKGEPCILSIARDIEQRIRDQKAISESEEKFRRLFENHSAVKLIIDPDSGMITEANQAAAQFYGWPVGNLMQMNLTEINCMPIEQIRQMMDKTLSLINFQFETQHRKADGTIADVEVFSSRVQIGGKYFLHAIIHDISEKKKFLKELIIAKEKAEESDRLKSAFLANMSHEIRTPMNGILGFLDLLRAPDLSEEDKDTYSRIVKKSGERLLTTINDIIEISKIEAGQVEVHTESIHLRSFCDYFFDFFRNEAKTRKIDFKVVFDVPDVNFTIETDRNKLESIVGNLLKNAFKFTTAGYIELGCRLEKDKILIYVEDSGRGIPADKIDSVFERFVQADTKITRSHEGSGLGLSIAKVYTSMLGGDIWVKSKEGQGSTFYVMLPWIKGAEKPDAAIQPKHETLDGSNKKILIAEDDETSYKYLKLILDRENFTVIRASDGAEAVKLCMNEGITLVLMDIKMPVMDGFEATRQIKKLNPAIPVIAQTAFALQGDREKIRDAGCDDYITKPIRRADLLKIIGKFID